MENLEKLKHSEVSELNVNEVKIKEKETQYSKKFTGEILTDFDSLRMKRFEYESIMEDIKKIRGKIKKMYTNEEVFKADRQIRSKWVPLARKALTEWIDAEIRFKEEYGEEARKKLDKGHHENPDYDLLAMEYEITEYSPKERKSQA